MTHLLTVSEESFKHYKDGHKVLMVLKNERGFLEGDKVLLQVENQREECELVICEICYENVKANHVAIVLKEKQD